MVYGRKNLGGGVKNTTTYVVFLFGPRLLVGIPSKLYHHRSRPQPPRSGQITNNTLVESEIILLSCSSCSTLTNGHDVRLFRTTASSPQQQHKTIFCCPADNSSSLVPSKHRTQTRFFVSYLAASLPSPSIIIKCVDGTNYCCCT